MQKKRRWGKAPYEIIDTTSVRRVVILNGRVCWASEELRKAGRAGRTGREALGPRWAAYIWSAIHVHGISIRDDWETQKGEHPGKHKRWWLDCEIRPLPLNDEGAA